MSNNKSSMKLYTEEQVMNYLTNHKSTITRYDLQNIPHIELPSDEEIENWANKDLNNFYKDSSFMRGVKYVLDKIQGGNND